ncbi:MAG: MATE family efflux transporter [Gammaproteobacteria bacterium]
MQHLGKIKNIMAIAVPIMLSNFTLLICILINTRVLGNYNKVYFYYLALAMPVNYILLAIYEAFRTCSLGICQATQNKNHQLIWQLKRMMFLGAVLIILLALFYVLVFGYRKEFDWFAITMLISSWFVVCSVIIGGALYALEKQNVAMFITISSSILLCLINYFLLHLNFLGIYSINIAVVLVYMGATWVGLKFLKSSIGENESSKTNLRSFLSIWRFLYSVGMPIFSLYIVIFVSLFVYNTILQNFGSEVVSAFSLVFRLQSVLMAPAIALGIATGIIINRLVARGEVASAAQYLKYTFVLTLIIYLSITVLIYLFSAKIIGWLVLDLKIQQAAVQCLHYFVFSYVGLGSALMYISVLEQTGYNKRGLFINCLLFVMQVVFGGFLALKFGSQIYFYATALVVNSLPLIYLAYTIFWDTAYLSQPSRLFLLAE